MMTGEQNSLKTGPDLVLIDDDPVIRDVWFFEADTRGLRLLALAEASEIEDYDLDLDTPIYVDLQLSHSVSGTDVARNLNRYGYRRISLTTGHHIDRASCPDFITEVIGKDFPANQ